MGGVLWQTQTPSTVTHQWTETPRGQTLLDRDPHTPRQRPPGQRPKPPETPLDRDPPPVDRDPLQTETPLDKRSEDVAPEVNFRECASNTPPPSPNKAAHSPKVQKRGISGPTKGHLSTKNYLKNSSNLTIYKILKSSYFSGEISFIALWFDTTLCFCRRLWVFCTRYQTLHTLC